MSFMEPPVRSQQKLWQRGEGSRARRRRERRRLSAVGGRRERTLGIPRGGVRASLARGIPRGRVKASLARQGPPGAGQMMINHGGWEVAVGLLGVGDGAQLACAHFHNRPEALGVALTAQAQQLLAAVHVDGHRARLPPIVMDRGGTGEVEPDARGAAVLVGEGGGVTCERGPLAYHLLLLSSSQLRGEW